MKRNWFLDAACVILAMDVAVMFYHLVDLDTKLKATQIELQACQTELDDPHRCVSICEEEFKKMGC